MPSIILPDRICSHCGGNKWYICYSISKNRTLYRCAARLKINNNRYLDGGKKNIRLAKQRQYTKNHPFSAIDRIRHKRYRDRRRDNLSDVYIKALLSSNNTIRPIDIHPELIQLKRKQLKLHRNAKQVTNAANC